MKNKKEKGQILIMTLLILVIMGIMVPAIVFWVRNEAQWSVKDQKSTIAFNLASAAVERGMWKLKSSTGTWNQAANGIPIAGYDFDVTYSDMPGGYYRIKFSSGPANSEMTVTGEGKDKMSQEKRAVEVVYRNQCIPGAVISRGMISWANAFEAHWGPIMAHNNIEITDSNAAQDYFPRKYSRQVVMTNGKGLSSYQRDPTGDLSPPNTDGIEWWSDYAVPDLPVLDFGALRSSAAATGTLNVYGCRDNPPAPWDTRKSCQGPDHSLHFGNIDRHPDSKKNYTWYWDGDVEFAGGTGSDGMGLYGTIIVRGNLTLDTGDNYSYTGNVPPDAWMEYTKITKTDNDTNATDEYPADDGYQKNRATFDFGSETWSNDPGTGSPPKAANTDVGVRGFIYCGGNLDIEGPVDVNGAIWVEGNVAKAVGSERCIVFFNDQLSLPTLNVVLVRRSWKEVIPSATAWANP